MTRFVGIYVLAVTTAMVINGCSGPKSHGSASGMEPLTGCPGRPNCVSSEARDSEHAIAPFKLKQSSLAGWDAVRIAVLGLPRTRIVTETDRYLHATCRSRLFGFIDDLEFQLNAVTGMISVRSASRVGYSDLGVNRRRVESLRQTLTDNGIIHEE